MEKSRAAGRVERIANGGALLVLLTMPWLASSLSLAQAAGVFGVIGLLIGVSQQFRRPTTQTTRRVFTGLFVLTCLLTIVLGGRRGGEDLLIGVATVGGWALGLGLAASFGTEEAQPVERSFSGQMIRRP